MSVQTISAPGPATDPALVPTVPSSTQAAERLLGALARRWPVNTRVRHATSGWVGTVRPDPDPLPGLARVAGDQAHGLLFDAVVEREPAGRTPCVVCVEWDNAPATGTAAPVSGPAWMRADRLRPAEPRRRNRTGR